VGTAVRPDERFEVLLNDNLWFGMAFAVVFLAAIVALLFLLAWIERPLRVRPSSAVRRSRAGPQLTERRR
jgi:hypothetical protein